MPRVRWQLQEAEEKDRAAEESIHHHLRPDDQHNPAPALRKAKSNPAPANNVFLVISLSWVLAHVVTARRKARLERPTVSGTGLALGLLLLLLLMHLGLLLFPAPHH